MIMNMSAYTCHKRVHAGQITAISVADTGHCIFYAGANGEACWVKVKENWMRKHTGVEVGGYLVVYEDGFMSYSPRAAFENGYTRG